MYRVIRTTKQLNEETPNRHQVRGSARTTYEAARVEAGQMAKYHAKDLAVKAPIEVDPGQFEFFTTNYTRVTYSVEEEYEMEKDKLHEELYLTLQDLNKQIDSVKQRASKLRVDAHDVIDPRGNSVLSSLLVAKAQILSAMVTLKATKPIR